MSSLHHLYFCLIYIPCIIVLSLNCASARSTLVCSTCVQGTNDIARNTLKNIHTKSCIGLSSKRGVFPVGVCLHDQIGLTGLGRVSRVKC